MSFPPVGSLQDAILDSPRDAQPAMSAPARSGVEGVGCVGRAVAAFASLRASIHRHTASRVATLALAYIDVVGDRLGIPSNGTCHQDLEFRGCELACPALGSHYYLDRKAESPSVAVAAATHARPIGA